MGKLFSCKFIVIVYFYRLKDLFLPKSNNYRRAETDPNPARFYCLCRNDWPTRVCYCLAWARPFEAHRQA